jgi:hypothetical protein
LCAHINNWKKEGKYLRRELYQNIFLTNLRPLYKVFYLF